MRSKLLLLGVGAFFFAVLVAYPRRASRQRDDSPHHWAEAR